MCVVFYVVASERVGERETESEMYNAQIKTTMIRTHHNYHDTSLFGN